MFLNAGIKSNKLNSNNNKVYQKGHITIFLSLMLTLVLSIVCTAIESARVQGAVMQLQNITDLGVFSVFGEYNKTLLDMYDLFYIDTGYGTSTGSKERVNVQLKDYIAYNIDATKGLSLVKNADIWRIEDSNVSTEKYVLATDSNGTPFFNQAIEYMEDKIGLSMAEELLGFYENDLEEKQEQYKNELENNDDNMAEVHAAEEEYLIRYEESLQESEEENSSEEESGSEEEEQEKEELAPPPDIENPLDTISTVKTGSILKLVMKDYESISNKSINLNDMPSKRSLRSGDGSVGESEVNKALANVLFNEYIFEKFPNLLSNKKTYGLKYQAEYILCGKSSDKENLEGVVNKLLLIREGINFAYLLTDGAKQKEALVLATALVGYLAIPALVVIVQAALMLAWAFAESVIEVRMLLSGKKVALMKNANNWNLSLSNLANINNELDSGTDDSDGLTYEQYLKILVFTSKKSKKVNRCLDMIEHSIGEKTSNSAFKIDNCTQEFNTKVNYNIGNVFMSMPFRFSISGSDNYSYTIEKYYKY